MTVIHVTEEQLNWQSDIYCCQV